MRTFKGVFNSDEINRMDIRFSLAALVESLSQRWSTGTPNSIGHDRRRVIGWSRPLGIHLQSNLARLTGVSWIGENNEDQRLIRAFTEMYYHQWIAQHVEPHIPELRSRLGNVLHEEPLRCDASCAAVVAQQLAIRVAPK